MSVQNSNSKITARPDLATTLLYNWYFLQAFNFCYFHAPRYSANITSFK